jgi:hypothetical protein
MDGKQACDGSERGGFSSPVGPKESNNTPLRHSDADTFENQDNRVVDHLEVVEF